MQSPAITASQLTQIESIRASLPSGIRIVGDPFHQGEEVVVWIEDDRVRATHAVPLSSLPGAPTNPFTIPAIFRVTSTTAVCRTADCATKHDYSLDMCFDPTNPENDDKIARQAASNDPTQRGEGQKALAYAVNDHPEQMAVAVNRLKEELPPEQYAEVQVAYRQALSTMGSEVASQGGGSVDGESVSGTKTALFAFAHGVEDPALRQAAVAASLGTVPPPAATVVLTTLSSPSVAHDNGVEGEESPPSDATTSPPSHHMIAIVVPADRIRELASMAQSPVVPDDEFFGSLSSTILPTPLPRLSSTLRTLLREGIVARLRVAAAQGNEARPTMPEGKEAGQRPTGRLSLEYLLTASYFPGRGGIDVSLLERQPAGRPIEKEGDRWEIGFDGGARSSYPPLFRPRKGSFGAHARFEGAEGEPVIDPQAVFIPVVPLELFIRRTYSESGPALLLSRNAAGERAPTLVSYSSHPEDHSGNGGRGNSQGDGDHRDRDNPDQGYSGSDEDEGEAAHDPA